jgi:hypothetical protein
MSTAARAAAGDDSAIKLDEETTEPLAPSGVGTKRSAEEALGRVPGPEGTMISARLRAAREAAGQIAAATAAETPYEGELDKIVAEIKSEMAKTGSSRKHKGGDKAAAIAYLKNLAQSFVEYGTTELAPLGAPVASLARGTVGLTQEVVIRVPVTIAALTISTTALSANFFKSLFAKFNAWGRANAVTLSSELTAEQAADAAVKDIPSIAKTSALTVVFFNQLGLLPLSAVLAAILFAVRANVSTGPARSLLISQFYTWYIMKPTNEQQEFIKAAKDYATQAAVAGRGALNKSSPAVAAVAKGVGDFIAKAGVNAATAASSLVPGSSSSSSSSSSSAAPVRTAAAAAAAPAKSAEDILSEGSPAASVVAVAAPIVRGQDVLEEGTSNIVAPGLEAELEPSTKKYILRRRALGQGSVGSFAIGQPSPNTAEAKRRKTKAPAESSAESSPSSSSAASMSSSSSTRSRAAPAVSPATKRKGGKRKTARKIKRRVTRRKPKMPTFVY